MFLYQSETDSHFECPQCGQHGTVPTAHLDAVLERNEHAVISCTKCMARFEPHAPMADHMRHTEPVHEEDIGIPQMPLEEAPEGGSEDELDMPIAAQPLMPDLLEAWHQYESPQKPVTSEAATSALPVWLQRPDK